MASNRPNITPAKRNRTDAMPRNNRSRVTNGSALLPGVDGRTRDGRRYRDLYRHYLAETGGEHETLVRQLCSLIVQRERMDAKLARGEDVDPLALVRVSGAITRVMERIGILADGEDEPGDATDAVIANLRASAQ